MSDFFKSFNRILGQRQRATMAYRPQTNGFAGRMVQKNTRALKIYMQDLDQRDWDGYSERLTFAIYTARDRIRGETPFYVIHGWDPRSTLESVIPVGSTRRHDRDPRRWRYRMQKYYQQPREQVNQRLREAIANRTDTHNGLSLDQGSGYTWIGCMRDMQRSWRTYDMGHFASLKRSGNMQ
ncbi:reverse transcriptase [Phytophthora megakarya]|uniref:Reverse transcriptase n=1 Tax=Phytophthora megakarya TaxID=4795 RepID=A0A225W1G8_9STRA|nr:reverse transcriptase [Phytophthora megakarya]